ncbi:hypothetical protein D9758_007634 [Tetrapyrgos nigripes]|uniref:Glyoxal oxidase n=1 Tax=Tetrapyrgos nigripes TaxID=182062 RepID=A0A8H5G7U6_9AGAR|nr:hypothetical protein D9758_007634 [Tetrapyrgos nigripes]
MFTRHSLKTPSVEMRVFSSSFLVFVLTALRSSIHVSSAYVEGDWVLTQDGTTGVSALQIAVTTETKLIILDRGQHNPLLASDGKNAMAAELDLVTRQVRPLNGAVSNPFCAGGGHLGNGTFVSTGGNPVAFNSTNGVQALRLFEPCDDESCDLLDDSGARLRTTSPRWTLFKGATLNTIIAIDEVNNPTYEFYPPKDINGFNGTQIPLKFLNDTLTANLFPYIATLPDGKLFVAANTQAMIFDWKTNTERRLPDIPNGVRISYPFSGSGALLPLTPENNYTPEILLCGGSNLSDTAILQLQIPSTQDPASKQCSRMVLTEEGIASGWKVEEMPIARTMGSMFLLPDGRLLIVNGAQTGYSGGFFAQDLVAGVSNADHPAFMPVVYDPNAPEGSRFSSDGIPVTNIARMYHSTATLTPNGTIFIAGSNVHDDVCFDQYPTTYRAEYLDPPYMFKPRPSLTGLPALVGYNQTFTLNLTMPPETPDDVTVVLMDLGFVTHGIHQSSRYVKLVSSLSEDGQTLTVTGPPIPQIYPPGPGYLFVVTSDGVPSPGKKILVGNGQSPPADEAVRRNMLDQTPPVNITFIQDRLTGTCPIIGGGETVTGSLPATAFTGAVTLPPTSFISTSLTIPLDLPSQTSTFGGATTTTDSQAVPTPASQAITTAPTATESSVAQSNSVTS